MKTLRTQRAAGTQRAGLARTQIVLWCLSFVSLLCFVFIQPPVKLAAARPGSIRGRVEIKRTAAPVERRPGVLPDQAEHFQVSVRLGTTAQVDGGPEHVPGWGDDLYGTANPRGEDRSQRLVPANEFREALLERRHVQRSLDADRPRDVVGVAAQLKLIQEPQSLLGEG